MRASGSRSAALCAALAVLAAGCTHPARPAPVTGANATVTIAYPYEPPTLDPFTFAGRSPATRDIVRLLVPSSIPARAPSVSWRPAGGPFVLRAWHHGLDMIFDRNPSFHPLPGIAHLRIVFVPDASAALALLRRGTVDVLGPYIAPDWARRARAAGAAVVSDAGASAMELVFGRSVSRADSERASAFAYTRTVHGLVQDEGETYGNEPAIAAAKGAPAHLTIAYASSDDLAGIVARAIQFQVRATGVDLQPIALDAGELWSSWLRGARMQLALVPLRGVSLDLRVTHLYRIRVSLAARAGVLCGGFAGAGIASADGPFLRAGEWRAC